MPIPSATIHIVTDRETDRQTARQQYRANSRAYDQLKIDQKDMANALSTLLMNTAQSHIH